MRVVAIPDKRIDASSFHSVADEVLDSMADFDPSKYSLPFNSVIQERRL